MIDLRNAVKELRNSWKWISGGNKLILLKKSLTSIINKNVKGLKFLTSTQMLQTLPIIFTQVQAGNTSENVLNEICQIGYALHWAT